MLAEMIHISLGVVVIALLIVFIVGLMAGVSMTRPTVSGADLREADLTATGVTDEQPAQAKSLKGAILPDGTKHDQQFPFWQLWFEHDSDMANLAQI